jgi:hypothetical protein
LCTKSFKVPFDKLRAHYSRGSERRFTARMGTVSLRASGIGALLFGGVMSEHALSFAKSDDGSNSPAPMREETDPKESVRVVSAVELV